MLQSCGTARTLTPNDLKSRKPALSQVEVLPQPGSCNTLSPVINLALLVLAVAAPGPVELPNKAAIFAAGDDTVAKTIAGRVEVELAKALKKKGVVLADVEELFPPPAAESSAEGDTAFAKGRDAYDNLDFDASAKTLSQAAVFFIKHPGTAKPEQLAEIFLFLGASELQNGAKADAKKEFARALQMNPALTPDTKYFGSDVQTAFNAAQKEMGTRKKGKLSVESTPAGAEVEAFGLSYGLTPVPEIELPFGRYLVRLKRPGYAPGAAFPDVSAKQPADVNQKLDAAPAYLALREKAERLIGKQPFEAPKLPLTGIDIGKAMKARFLVLASVTTEGKGSKVELQVWNITTGDRLKGVTFNLDADGAGYETGADAVQSWLSRPAAAVSAAVPVAEAEPVKPSEGGSVLKKWWFWTAVGAVAVGAGVTTAVVASQPHGPGGFNTALGQP